MDRHNKHKFLKFFFNPSTKFIINHSYLDTLTKYMTKYIVKFIIS